MSCAKLALAAPALSQIGPNRLMRISATADSYCVQERGMLATTREPKVSERSGMLAADFGENVVAHDPSMLRVLRLAESLAHYHAAVLITGETGSGKEVV